MSRSLCAIAILAALATGARAQTRSGSVDVTVTVRPDGMAAVEQQYVIAPGPPVALRLLTRPCVAIEAIHLERGGRVMAAVEEVSGPWLTLRDTSAAPTDTFRLTARYLLHLGGDRPRIPLMHLSAPLAGTGPSGSVHITVRFADSAGAVLFPHMTRGAPEAWTARYVAMPSFVRIKPAGAIVSCMTAGETAFSDGGLLSRFLLLVVIMVAWVPTYLAWARRSGAGAE